MGKQTNNPSYTTRAGAAVARFALVAIAADGDYEPTAANGRADGIAQDIAAADGALLSVRPFSAGGEHKVLADGSGAAIAIGDQLVAGAGGKAIKLPAGAGTYYSVGIAGQASTADGDIITVLPTNAGVALVVT